MTAKRTNRTIANFAVIVAAGSLTGCGMFGGSDSKKQAAAEAEQMEAAPVAFQESFNTSDFNQLNHRVLAEYDHFIIEPSSFSFYGGRGFKRGQSNEFTGQFDRFFRNEMMSGFPVVTRPGPNTARVEVRFTDFRRSQIWQNANSGFDPMAPEMGEAFAEVRMIDSHSGEVVGRFLVEQSSGDANFASFMSPEFNSSPMFADFASQIREQIGAMSYDALRANASANANQ